MSSNYTSSDIVKLIENADFSQCSATIVGFGYMGKQYLNALSSLGVGQIQICSRSLPHVTDLNNNSKISVVSGGTNNLKRNSSRDELAIVATPVDALIETTYSLADLGFHKILIEKPVALHSDLIRILSKDLQQLQIQSWAAFNRLAYPSYQEVYSACQKDGGITSCTYSMTEYIEDNWTTRFSNQELNRWGIANSIHVISMAHGLIGLPTSWNAVQNGFIKWHPTGSIFTGNGISERGIPFCYHSDWKSKSRWGLEVHTEAASYRLSPLESCFRKTENFSDWHRMQTSSFDQNVKPGILEQLAFLLGPIEDLADLSLGLDDTAILTQYAESIFGYE